MTITRRAFVGFLAATSLTAATSGCASLKGNTTMYGLIGKMNTVAGQRDALAAILLEGTRAMPGCLSYIVAQDPTNPDALWITEVWDRKESHQASLALPEVKAAINKGRPLIAGFGERFETTPIGGQGIAAQG